MVKNIAKFILPFLIFFLIPSLAFAQNLSQFENLSKELGVNVSEVSAGAGINIQEIISKYPGTSLFIREVGDLSDVKIQAPIIVMGSQADVLEKEGLTKVLENFKLSAEALETISDTMTEYKNKSIWDYDLILIGGPQHNAVTKQLVEQGYLNMSKRDTSKLSFVIENSLGPKGKTVMVAASIYGYKFDKKDLPLENIIPEEAASTVAVVTGVGGVGLVFLLGQKLSLSLGKFANFLQSGLEEVTEEVIGEIEEKRMKQIKKPQGFFGFTAKELALGVGSAIIFGAAYAWADLQSKFLSSIWIYVLAAGLAVVVHEFAHNILAYKYKADAQFRFWWTGLAFVIATAYLFGNVFAVPGRTIVKAEHLDKKQRGMIYLIGPAANILFAALLLAIAPLSPLISQIAHVGVPISLLLAIYNLMPFKPMDGKHVRKWSRAIWALAFIPLFLFYFYVYLL